MREQFGRFDGVLEPGCHCMPWCVGYRVAGGLSLRVQQLDVRCETKTKDNVFVTVVSSIQYHALAEKACDAYYKLTNTKAQIQSYVFYVIRSSMPKLELDAAFEQKNEIAKAVEDELEKAMSTYGFEIVQTLIVDIEPDVHVKRAMNEINAGSSPLPWSIRMKIALGAAKGLAFLHEEAEKHVIYRDFKTSNILLDADYNAKLSNFGLAKDGPEGDKTHVSTQVMGTYGYADPEYVMTGHLRSKSDVYSFGVVLLEMLTGRRSLDMHQPNGEHNLVEWARPHFGDRRRFYQLLDPRLEGHFSIKGAQKVDQLSAECLSRDPKVRPKMSDVVDILKPLPDMEDMATVTKLTNERFGRMKIQKKIKK